MASSASSRKTTASPKDNKSDSIQKDSNGNFLISYPNENVDAQLPSIKQKLKLCFIEMLKTIDQTFYDLRDKLSEIQEDIEFLKEKDQANTALTYKYVTWKDTISKYEVAMMAEFSQNLFVKIINTPSVWKKEISKNEATINDLLSRFQKRPKKTIIDAALLSAIQKQMAAMNEQVLETQRKFIILESKLAAAEKHNDQLTRELTEFRKLSAMAATTTSTVSSGSSFFGTAAAASGGHNPSTSSGTNPLLSDIPSANHDDGSSSTQTSFPIDSKK